MAGDMILAHQNAFLGDFGIEQYNVIVKISNMIGFGIS